MITRWYGDLEIGYTTRWNGSVHAGTASRTGAWRTLGSVFGGGFVWNWQDAYGALVVQDRSAGQDLLKPPVDFQHVGRFPGFSVSRPKCGVLSRLPGTWLWGTWRTGLCPGRGWRSPTPPPWASCA